MKRVCVLANVVGLVAALLIACGGGGSTGGGPIAPNAPPTNQPNGGMMLVSGFTKRTIATVPGARELAALPNGDLLVGTHSFQIYIVPNAESAGSAGAPSTFITLPDSPAQSVAISTDHSSVYAATQHGVYKIPYHSGDRSEPNASALKIASVRSGPISPGSDGDVHTTSSVAASTSALYVGVGSSCNACTEVDPTRASIQAMNLDGGGMHTIATKIRNAIALTINPATGALWAGVAGQDKLPYGHPYEFVDAVTLHAGSPVDYGWPACEENRHAYTPGANCSSDAIPRVEFPAYSTHIGAVFYPLRPIGPYAFPAAMRGSLFVTSHGSWHCCPATPPEVAYVPMTGDMPQVAVNWSDPMAQWRPFMWAFGVPSNTHYIGRPTGIAVGSQGSLFVSDDQNGVIYRIRPSIASR